MAIIIPIVSSFDPKGVDQSVVSIKKADGAWAKTGATMKALKGPALAVGAGLVAGGALAVKSASALGETMNAVDKTFGTAAGTIKAYGETAAESAGLSQREFQQLGTVTGAVLKNMGQNEQEAADNTIALTQRAADMASVFDTDVSTALEAVNSGLKGEAEPLKQFGVGLSAAKVEAYALENGLMNTEGELDDVGKAAAIQGLIMEQTADYAGDFADTQDSVANSSKIAGAQMEELSAELGEVLLPYVETGIGLFRDLLGFIRDNSAAVKVAVGVIGSLAAVVLVSNAAMSAWDAVSRITKLATDALTSSTVKNTAVWLKNTAAVVASKVAQLAAAAATKAVAVAQGIMTAAQWALNAALTANPIGLVVAAIALLIAGLVLAYKKSDTFRAIVDGLGRTIRTVAGYITRFLIAGFRQIWSWIQKLLRLFDSLRQRISDAFSFRPPSWLGGLFGGSSSAAYSVPGVATRSAGGSARATGPVTINLSGSGDPYRDAKVIKRALEGYDRGQGRAPWSPLAVSW